MANKVSLPIPAGHALGKLGRDIAVARRKRRISTADMAARLFVSRDTLWRLERGDPTVSAGTLTTVLFVLGLHDRLANLAAPSRDGGNAPCRESFPGRAGHDRVIRVRARCGKTFRGGWCCVVS